MGVVTVGTQEGRSGSKVISAATATVKVAISGQKVSAAASGEEVGVATGGVGMVDAAAAVSGLASSLVTEEG